jgi:hypothetical protein
MACDVNVCRADLVARRKVGQRQGDTLVMRHQMQHPFIEFSHRMTE